MYSKKDTIKVLMKRDKLSEEEVMEHLAGMEEEMLSYIDEDNLEAVEEIFTDYTGLEPDYMMDFVLNAGQKS